MYYRIRIRPSDGSSSGTIEVDKLHPKWRNDARKFQRSSMAEYMQQYAQKVGEWSGVPLDLEFSDDYGLKSIKTPGRGSLDLDANDGSYCSHNIDSSQSVCAVAAVICEYLNHLELLRED